MKRCSECDFIYEDDQNLCDMDGHELVSDPTLPAFPVNATTTRSAKSRVRRLILAAATAAIVGALLFVGYSGLTSEYVPQTTKAPPAKVNRAPIAIPDQSPVAPSASQPRQSSPDQSIAAPGASPSPTPSQPPRLEKTRARPVAGSPLASSTPGLESSARARETVRSEPTKANHKKDSGIGGFLKKTGNILKRPFKL
jgi:hypothetical protein